jgi:peptidoglycan/xylan/chitin deacetylase (PgdA/CDA1 family)
MLAKLKNKKILIPFLVFLTLLNFGFSVWIVKDFYKSPPTNIIKTSTASSQPTATITPTPATNLTPSPPNQPAFTGTPPEIAWGNRDKKQVIFTFDGGSGIQSAQAILDTLAKHKVKGTLFLTGSWVSKNPDLTKQIAKKGYEIYNHTYNHPYLTQIPDAQIISELKAADDLVFNLTGKHTKPYFRPPYGARNDHVREVAAKEGYQSVYWTIDALDWKESSGTTADQVKARIMENLKPGTIYLMHIGDNITGQILDEVFQQIKGQGYSIVSLSQGIK